MKRYLLAACLLTFSSAAMAAPSQGNSSKIHPLIRQYADQVPTLLSRAQKNNTADLVKNPIVRVNSEGKIETYIHLNNIDQTTLDALKNTGAIIGKAVKNTVQATVSPSTLQKIAMLDSVTSITPPRYAIVRQQGTGSSEADSIINTDDVRNDLGFTGAGIKVGVISNGVGGVNASVASADLPDGDDTSCTNQGSGITCGEEGSGSEGTAMMEIIYDMAPDAELYFYGVSNSIEMIEALDYLTNDAVVDIIVDDLGFPGEPFFEDGDVADEVQASIDAGVIYISAAGNDADVHVQEEFDDTDADDEHNFDGSGNDYFIVQVGSSADIYLQWDDANYEAPTNDLDLTVQLYSNADDNCFDDDSEFNGGTLLETYTSAEDNINGGSAVEYAIEYVPVDQDGCALIFITRSVSDSTPLTFEMITYGIVPGTGGNDIEYTVEEDSIYGHPAIEEAIAVGTINSDEPGNDEIASYSSQGPATVSGVERDKPDVIGIDEISVTGSGGFLTPFSGTSAAAPGVAACAALMLEANPDLDHTQVKSVLEGDATDLGVAGFDFIYGNGLVNCSTATTTADATTGNGRTREAPASGGGESAASCSFTPNSSFGSNWIYVLLVAGFVATLRGMKRKKI